MTNEVKSNSSWNEYSKLVLKELETLASGIESLSSELKTLKEAIQRLELREDKVDDVWSPPQMKDQIEKVQAQEVFKTRAITVFAVIQFLMASALFAQKFL